MKQYLTAAGLSRALTERGLPVAVTTTAAWSKKYPGLIVKPEGTTYFRPGLVESIIEGRTLADIASDDDLAERR